MRAVAGRSVWVAFAVLGVAGLVATWHLDLRDAEIVLAPWVRVVMGAAGLILIGAAARGSIRAAGVVASAVGLLGVAVLAYPSILALGATSWGGAPLSVAASAFHVLPLTLVQLLPVIASGTVLHTRHRTAERTIVAVAVSGVMLTGIGLAGAPGASVLLAVSVVAWFGSFLIAPIVTVAAVRGASGEDRRRAVVTAIASLVPVIIIGWCLTVGAMAEALGMSSSTGVNALMVGLASAALGCGGVCLAALAHPGARLLQARAVTAVLHVLLGALCVIVGAVATVAVAADLPSGGAVAVGAVSAIAVGVPWLRLHSWVRRVVDPAAELRHELAVANRAPAAGQRHSALHVLRRLVGDPGLILRYRLAGDWVAFGSHEGAEAAGVGGVDLATDAAGDPIVRADASSAAAAQRLRALGDCTVLLRSAHLEAHAEFETARAEEAATQERRRLAHDLHDGLQGRLLGLALHLQLSAQTLDDPAARLLVDDAVAGLRGAVDDVRSLGGGQMPDILTSGGLRAALPALFRPVGPLIHLDLSADRFAGEAEATAYFVIAEAVTNALKHAGATRIGVCVTLDGSKHERVEITVRDDGRGGADPRLGAGLRGVAERVSAAGGTLVVHEAHPHGTVLEAVLPCGS